MSELTYAGKGRFLVGIPADDLSTEDVAAIAHRRGKTTAQLRKELVDSGLYRETKPASPAKET